MPETSTLTRFTYNPASRRYRDRVSGKFVSAKDVRSAVDTIIDKETAKIRSVAQQLVDGSINLAEWQLQTQALLKTLHVSMGLAANGGLASTSNSDLGFIASQIKQQYQFLRSFAVQIKNGSQPLDGSLVSRAGLYTQASRSIYENVVQRGAMQSGLSQSRSVLGLADHCDQCVSEAKRGWVQIGSNISIGQRSCKQNCRCLLEFK